MKFSEVAKKLGRFWSSESQPKTAINHGEQYDKYYGGQNSIYRGLYKDKIIARDKAVIKEEALRIASTAETVQGQKVLRILDYGCGDGRYFALIKKIAHMLKEQGIAVELVAYDPSKVGLQTFEEKLQQADYAKVAGKGYHDIADKTGGTRGYVANTYRSEKDNLTVKFIHGHVDDKLDHIAGLIGQVNLTLCMFGVLSHIPGKKNRIELLEMLGEITDGSVIVTVPSHRILPEQHKVFDYLRKHHYSENRLGKALEAGDLHYTRYQKAADGTVTQIENFYHVYGSSREVLYEMMAAKLFPRNGIQTQKVLAEATLTKHPNIAKLDEWVSRGMPSFLAEHMAGYYLAVAERPRELEKLPRKFTCRVTAEKAISPISNRIAAMSRL